MWILILAAMVGADAAATTPAKAPRVALETSKGTIVLELYPDKAPATVANFLEYARTGFFAGTIFHRVIPDFMIQGGGFTANMQQKPTRAPVKNESTNGVSNARGTVAMARTNDPHSATAQFFINLKDNTFLDQAGARGGFGYTVFGKVVSGMDVVDAIAGVATVSKGGHENVPREAVTITKATVQ
jgi:cyclophilin family peptidyl-prolyl cis-trans isomerase